MIVLFETNNYGYDKSMLKITATNTSNIPNTVLVFVELIPAHVPTINNFDSKNVLMINNLLFIPCFRSKYKLVQAYIEYTCIVKFSSSSFILIKLMYGTL